MDAAIYARKSTEQNGVADEAKSVARQVAGARAFIAGKGWELHEAHIYVDDGISGALFEGRPEFQRMLRDAEIGAFEAIVFFDLDRFGRNGKRSMDVLYQLTEHIEVWDYSTNRRLDLDSLEGEMTTFMHTRFAQQFREQIRKHTRAAMRRKAEEGFVAGGRVFGYDNICSACGRVIPAGSVRCCPKAQTKRVINEQEAAVVRDIYERAALGESARSIVRVLNALGLPTPRAQQGRASGWSSGTVRAVLERPLYRGELVFGRTTKAYDRELRKVYRHTKREKGQVRRPESEWLRIEVPELRIVDAVVAERADAVRLTRRERYLAAVAKGGHVPQRSHGRYLLSGGLLVCPTCGGHFEARMAPWQGIKGGVYICSTRRRKPGVCANTLALPIAETEDAVLSMVEGEMFERRVIDDLLRLVDTGAAELATHLAQQRGRLQDEIQRLLDSVAAGIPASTVAPAIKTREAELSRVNVQLAKPRPAPPDLPRLRAALEQRAEQWKADLRAEPKVAQAVLRRVIGPIVLWDEPRPEWCRWEAKANPAALLDGLAFRTDLVASPSTPSSNQLSTWFARLDSLRRNFNPATVARGRASAQALVVGAS